MLFASHAWITRYLFPLGGESKHNQYVLHFDDPSSVENLLVTFYTFLRELSEEVGGYSSAPVALEKDRFLIEGPKGFSIIELAPGLTQEEFDELNKTLPENLDLSVWEGMFKAELPEEKSDERTKQ